MARFVPAAFLVVATVVLGGAGAAAAAPASCPVATGEPWAESSGCCCCAGACLYDKCPPCPCPPPMPGHPQPNCTLGKLRDAFVTNYKSVINAASARQTTWPSKTTRSSTGGHWDWATSDGWTSGFFPGLLWQLVSPKHTPPHILPPPTHSSAAAAVITPASLLIFSSLPGFVRIARTHRFFWLGQPHRRLRLCSGGCRVDEGQGGREDRDKRPRYWLHDLRQLRKRHTVTTHMHAAPRPNFACPPSPVCLRLCAPSILVLCCLCASLPRPFFSCALCRLEFSWSRR